MLFYETGFTYKCDCGNDAIKFVSQRSKEKLESMDSNNEGNKESSGPNHNEDKDQIEEE